MFVLAWPAFVLGWPIFVISDIAYLFISWLAYVFWVVYFLLLLGWPIFVTFWWTIFAIDH
jgi:hypothetical protein